MTTLPTTSSIRLPRSGGPGGQVLAMPAATLGAPVGGSQEPFLTPADFWRILRRSWLLIFVSLVVTALAGTGLWYFQLKTNPRYTSNAQVLIYPQFKVDPRTQTLIRVGEDNFDLRVELRTQMQQLLNSTLWMTVLDKNPKIRETSWYMGFVAQVDKKGKESDTTPASLAKADLVENFRVSPVTDTKLLKISMEAAKAEDAQEIIQDIVEAHIQSQQEAAFERTKADLEMANQWKQRYQRELDSASGAMNAARSVLGGDGVIETHSGSGMVEMELSHFVTEQIRTKIEYNNAKTQLDMIEQQIRNNEMPAGVDQAIRVDQKIQSLEGQLMQLDREIARNRATSGDSSRILKQLEADRDQIKAQLANETRKARVTYREALVSQTRSAVDNLQAQLNTFNDQIEAKRKELEQITTQMVEYYSNKEKVETFRVLVREMEDRIAALKSNMGNERIGVRWAATPDHPDVVSSPKLSVYLPGALLIGLVFSVGVAFLREILDTTVKSPRDIARVGSMNVLGMVADESDDPQLSGVPLHAVISQAPHSLMAEQFRQVRTRLQHAASLDTTRTIVITSPGPQDGKSMVACNLAAGLALNGRRILLVDANFRRPELHRLFNLNNESGFSNVLDSVSNLESAVQKSATPNLDILTTGPKASNPTELLESQLFSDFIDRALEEYDHVLFDTGPLLVVSEAVALAPRVDGVITVVRARVNSRGMLTRVRDTLKQIKAEHLGVVLNGVQTWGGGYYGRNIKTYYAYQNTAE